MIKTKLYLTEKKNKTIDSTNIINICYFLQKNKKKKKRYIYQQRNKLLTVKKKANRFKTQYSGILILYILLKFVEKNLFYKLFILYQKIYSK